VTCRLICDPRKPTYGSRGAVVAEAKMTHPSVRTTAPSSDKSGAIELTIRRESVSSELQRVSLLIVLLAFFLVVLAVLHAAPELISATLRRRMLPAISPMAAVIALYLAYEIGVRLWLRSLLRRGRMPPAAFRYWNAFLEVSLPTVVLAVGTFIVGALPMLAGAVPFIYFPFIVLAALNPGKVAEPYRSQDYARAFLDRCVFKSTAIL
jgi:hypothetical protein